MDQIAKPKFVVIGGGTGSFALLTGLKRYAEDITALVSMVDDGGSTGQLRDEYGVLPPGDARQCLVALSESSLEMRDLFNYRFPDGSFEGHSFGNIFLTAVENMTGDFGQAVRLAGDVLNVRGRVLPITLTDVKLVVQDGKNRVVGEHLIDKLVLSSKKRPQISVTPAASINPEARQAILDADVVILAPGSLYESLIANFVVDGTVEALQQTKAKVVQVINLVTKLGQTDNWSVADYVHEVERFLGKDTVDYVLYNDRKPTKDQLTKYAKAGEFPVRVSPAILRKVQAKAVGKPLLGVHTEAPAKGDKLAPERSLMRHDPDALARALMRIYFS
jgi:uncharacterized cofD-like protein